MKQWLTLPVACMLAAGALAQNGPDCRAMLADRSVPALTKRGIAAACERAKRSENCDKQADNRKLAGIARQNFMAQCEGAPRARQSRGR